jgi:hypothetical protein
MAPGEKYPYARIALNIVVSLGLFTGLFLGVFWTPGLLLGLFATAYAADSNALSQGVDRAKRLRAVALEARTRRGGWLDSAASRS